MADVVEFTLVFFFQAFAEKFGGDKAGFAVGEVAAGLFAKFRERSMREANDARVAFVVKEKFSVDGVCVAGGDAVPHVGETAMIDTAAQF